MLLKVTVYQSEQASPQISQLMRYKLCHLQPGVGLEFTIDNPDFQFHKKLYFGQSLTEVLEKFGNPNKQYFSKDKLFLNYLELGLDILICPNDFSVKKIIVHTNNTEMPDFGFYDRCPFQLKLKKRMEQREIKGNEAILNESKIHNHELSDDSDDAMASGIKTPPNKQSQVIQNENTIDELESHLVKLKLPDVAEEEKVLGLPLVNDSFMMLKQQYVDQELTVTCQTEFSVVHQFLRESPAND